MIAFFRVDDDYNERVLPLESQILVHFRANKYPTQQKAASDFWRIFMHDNLILQTRWGNKK